MSTPVGPSSTSRSPKSSSGRMACLLCRSRKTKCDRNEPCLQCLTRGDECEYEAKRKSTNTERALTERLAVLQSRYDALSPELPKQTFGGSHSFSSASPPDASSLAMRREARGTGSPEDESAAISNEIRDKLLDIAVNAMERSGFYIHSTDVLLGLDRPVDEQPHPALVNSLMLLATWFASPTRDHLPAGTPSPEYFVRQVRLHLTDSLGNADRLLSHLDASTCLAWWLIQQGRFLEGQYEISVTARLAIDCGLHQIDEQVIKGVVPPSSHRPFGVLGSPTTVKEIEARISTFWRIFLCDKCAALLTGLPPAFDEHTSDPKSKITTAWPKASGQYMAPWSSDDFASIDDLTLSTQLVPFGPAAVQPAFRTVPPPATSVAAGAQMMTLALRASRLASTTPQTVVEAQTLRTSLITLNNALSRLTATVPPLAPPTDQGPPFPYDTTSAELAFFKVATVTCAAYFAIIHMHRAGDLLRKFDKALHVDMGGSGSKQKRLGAAQATMKIADQLTAELDSPGSIKYPKDGLCMILPFFWTASAFVLGERISELRAIARSSVGSDSTAISSEEQAVTGDLNKILNSIRRLVDIYPALDGQVKEVERMTRDA